MINKKPFIEVKGKGASCWEGWKEITAQLRKKIASLNKNKVIIAVECYQGTYEELNIKALKEELTPNATCRARDIYKDESQIFQLVKRDLSGSLISAKSSTNIIEDYFDTGKLEALRRNIDFIDEGVVLIYGIGASKIWDSDVLVYADMSRWEILQRFRRNDISNIGVSNEDDPYQLHYKWSYFIDWRVCDKLKRQILPECDYFLETNNWKKPKLATGEIVRKGLQDAASQPFFLAPFFDPELWEVKIAEDQTLNEEDFSWGFNCDVEENNLLFKFDKYLYEVPATNLILSQPQRVLGEDVFKKFGSELPIRFNFIDKTEGNHFKLTFYPGTDFLRDNFGINYNQGESYYVMDAKSKAKVHLGLKDGISKEYFKEVLFNERTSPNGRSVKNLMNEVNLKKHDHLLIPVETVHCDGEKAMILHISSAPAIFNFNLLENEEATSGSLGSFPMDQVIDFITSMNHENHRESLHNQVEKIGQKSNYNEEILKNGGVGNIEIHRLWFKDAIEQQTNGTIQVINLIEGSEIQVESPSDEFQPFIVHYAETFIVPASVKEYIIRPKDPEGQYALIKTTVRS